MITWDRGIRIVFAVGLLLFASSDPATGQTSGPIQCRLEFTRADNMWGSAQDSHTSLGPETLLLRAGQKKAFVTDWRFEKTRNDGTTYYGSHARTYTNTGTRIMKLMIKPSPLSVVTIYLDPGFSRTISADIVEVACP